MRRPAMTDSNSPEHPGAYVRRQVLPEGMSVTAASSVLGIGRPALSNFLNGRSGLSSEMATRLEKSFGADRQKLLLLQQEYDEALASSAAKSVAVRSYVPSVVKITANQIEEWGKGLQARSWLPVLARKLANSTPIELRKTDFPGYDNAERKGWDGVVEAVGAAPWIPEGKSGWELGTSKDIQGKADRDYAARVASVAEEERKETTFVFVTPRNWPAKNEWAKAKEANGHWKAVKVLDASDLEQWIEQSIPVQLWLGEQLILPTSGVETPEHCWVRWATASEPQMTREAFAPEVERNRTKFRQWLEAEPERPFVVAADSKEEALAFVSCLLRDKDSVHGDRAVVVNEAWAIRKLGASTSPIVFVVHSDELEREVAPFYRQRHCVVVRPKNAIDSEPDISLDILQYDAFQKALAEMKVDSSQAERLSRESGRSLTILRRRLSKIDAVRRPKWAEDQEIATKLVPVVLIGAWRTQTKADREVLRLVADRSYEEIEQLVARLSAFDDSPVWSIGLYHGVSSKIDALFAVARYITLSALNTFFVAAEYVLSETDPALELPEDQRWAAGIYGKVRDHSKALREGICETLVILAVHGNNLFQQHLGIDIEAQVAALIRRLLCPLTLQGLLSHDRDLPAYAEAAPDQFLKLLEEDLRSSSPVVLGLLKPSDTSILGGGCLRSSLLWALECVAWNSQYLPRVAIVLARLSQTKIDDNWANKPIATLASIFRAWMPQTAASIHERIKALELINNRFPEIGWEVVTEQFKPGSRIGSYNYKPRWRGDASGAGDVVTTAEMVEFVEKCIDLALSWPKHTEHTLGDLVDSLEGLRSQDESRVWELVEAWLEGQPSDRQKAALRERIRRQGFTRFRVKKLAQKTKDAARRAYERLMPNSVIVRHEWLFADEWVEESVDELQVQDDDFRKRDERIDQARRRAMGEIWNASGIAGPLEALAHGCNAYVLGRYIPPCLKDCLELQAVLTRCIREKDPALKDVMDRFLQGICHGGDSGAVENALVAIAPDLTSYEAARIAKQAPFKSAIWQVVARLGPDVRRAYWSDVVPYWNRHSPEERSELINALLEHHRPRAAFRALHLDWSEIETLQLKRLLEAVGSDFSEAAGTFPFREHEVSEAFASLSGRAGISQEEMARLEFTFIDVLHRSEHGIPNLAKQIADSPAFFAQAVALSFKKKGGEPDPSGWYVDAARAGEVGAATYRLLDTADQIPGSSDKAKISLPDWIADARRLCAKYGREETGDHSIGQLLSKAPRDDHGTWPPQPICEALESIGSRSVASGFATAVYNERGAHWRQKGADAGKEERELADRYRKWAQQLRFKYPFVATVLEDIASMYDYDAKRNISDAKLEQRLRD